MHRPALGRVFSLVIIALIQVIAIVDFNFDDDPKSDAQLCCMVEHAFPQEPFRKCYEQHKTSTMDNEAVMCIHQCYYIAIGMFTEGDKLETANYLKYKDSLEPALQEPFSFALVACAKVTIQLIKQMAESKTKMRCSPIPYLFNRCLMEVDLANCPNDRWLNSSLCDELMKKLKVKYGAGIRLNRRSNGKQEQAENLQTDKKD